MCSNFRARLCSEQFGGAQGLTIEHPFFPENLPGTPGSFYLYSRYDVPAILSGPTPVLSDNHPILSDLGTPENMPCVIHGTTNQARSNIFDVRKIGQNRVLFAQIGCGS